MGCVTSVDRAIRQDLVACGKADGLAPDPGNKKQHGLPSDNSAGGMPSGMGRLSNGVGHQHPVTRKCR